MTATVYGVPRSQAHPRAWEETEAILRPLTEELVMGRHGPRVIGGDFNRPAGSSRELAIWRDHGWQEIQDLALARWGKAVEMTCKHATRHDFLWLSPEAAALCSGSEVHHSFVDHVVLEAKLHVPSSACRIFTWPRPSTIPWDDTQVDLWHQTVSPLVAGPSEGLPVQCKGRATRIEPSTREVCPGVLRASRPGEAVIANDLLGREVKRWFQRLRRLQSLKHALGVGKQTDQARQYRSQLWRSVLNAKGFAPTFADWWPRRVVRLHGAPQVMQEMPNAAQAAIIYDDFHSNYRKLESWHLRKRSSVLQSKYAESSRVLFAAFVRPDHLCSRRLSGTMPTKSWGLRVPCAVFPPGKSALSRWNQHVEIRPEHWDRIQQWLCTVRKLKKTAARGPDAYARLDLLNMVEVACLRGVPLAGGMADVVKAFNGLPRVPLLRAAARLGFPQCVLKPWVSFISLVKRRFLMGEAVSEAVASTSGFIEGDPLSVTAMSVASILYHQYMHFFEPRVQHASYVDNLAVTAESVYLAARGFCVMESFWEILGLQLDNEKSYFWATTAQDRKLLVSLGLTVAEHRRELGGYLTFGPRHRVADMAQRLELLTPIWPVLRRSRAPARQKWAAVTTKFWPMVFHGAASCWLSDTAVDKLRAKMAWALGWTCAGAGPDLRALTEGPMELDPAFFQIWTCMRDFQRLASKSSTLQQLWVEFMGDFHGRSLAGPFSTLHHHAEALNWGFLEPPQVTDHRGSSHDFLTLPKRSLRRLLEDAWAQKVMRRQASRAALRDMGDLDIQLARELGPQHNAQQRAWLGMVRAGAAITASQQACFDLSKTDCCLHCQVPDTREHRLFDCPLFQGGGLVRDAGDNRPLTELLLPCWHPELGGHLRDLVGLPDMGWQWTRPPNELPHVDIFTDGSCMYGAEDYLALGAWAAVCAQMSLVVASGLMVGLCQTIDRCELFAILVALRWTADVGCGLTIWTDSKFAFEGLLALLHGETCAGLGHQDLWREIEALIPACRAVYAQWVPSHVDPGNCDDPVAAYAAQWNQVADRQAGLMNHMRAKSFLGRHARILQHRQNRRRRMRALAAQYVKVAEATNVARRHTGDHEDVPLAELVQCEAHMRDGFADLFPPNWFHFIKCSGGFGQVEARDIVQRLLTSDEEVAPRFWVSWIELVFLVVMVFGCGDQYRGRTLSYWVSCVRQVLRPLLIRFGARGWLARGAICGVCFAVETVLVGVSSEDFAISRNLFQEWRAGRVIKKIADLSRPLRP
ncbi:rnhA [Symbiodinium pilosum]|uniref:RnhA protein n=1 Tax=Symbiodinium pilosum TaxID=2952 RepID=A0A812NAC8_SYMPI|nr:rnhA [Symbiodinium pilosum]